MVRLMTYNIMQYDKHYVLQENNNKTNNNEK